jgi:uroporphyrinogen III methyltransferase/synthase
VDLDNKRTGTVILVGAGPGDPGLLTVKGKEALARADCVIYDRLASPKLLLAAKDGCELIYVGKADHHHVLPQEEINALLVKKAQEYSTVVRLKGGDPYVFGRGGEEGIYLAQHGVDFCVIPGISSAIAGPAAAGIPITHRGTATGFHVLTAHGKENRLTDIDFTKLTEDTETCVFLMGLKHVREVADNLILAGRRADTPAAVISHATTEEQCTCVGTLADIADKVKHAALTSPAIIVVGEVVSLRGQLARTPDKGALSGKQYIVPYIKNPDGTGKSLAALLLEQDALVCEIPVGEIRRIPFELPVDTDAGQNANTAAPVLPDWLIFTSRNAVDGFFTRIRELQLDVRAFANTRIAAIGAQTMEKLKTYGLFADFVPSAANSGTLADEFPKAAGSGASIWYIKGAEGGSRIAEAFRGNPHYREIPVYENREITCDLAAMQEFSTRIEHADGIFFTSASCVRRISRITEHFPREIYSIGPSCTRQLHELGHVDIRQADTPSYESLMQLPISIVSH